MIGRLTLLLLALGATRDDPLADRVAGPAVDCIDLDRVQGPEIIDSRTVLYRQNAGRVWRTGPIGACSTMRPGDGLIVEVQGRRLCRGDRFRVRAAGYIGGAVCRLDRFVPYDRSPPPRYLAEVAGPTARSD